jgi:cysteine desulfurase
MMMKFPIYLDNNATTPVDPRVLEAMMPYFTDKFGNASSKHSFGYIANAAVEHAREQIAKLINADTNEIYFTSGATESINLVHFGTAEKFLNKRNHIISSNVEHSASYESLLQLQKKGVEVSFTRCDAKGFIHPEIIVDEINADTFLVSIIAANNEIGTINNISEIGKLCRNNNILFHTDATQAVGKIKIDVKEMNIDFMSFSSHKIYGPIGVGALFIRKGCEDKILPLMFGGGQEKGIRPGTLNTPAIVGFGKAAEICSAELEAESKRIRQLRDYFYKKIASNLDSVKLNGDIEKRLPGNLNLFISGVKSDVLIANIRDIAFSTGATCSSETGKPSRILKAIGLSDDEAKSSIRLGIGRFNTDEEIDYAADKFVETISNLRMKKFQSIS